MAVWKKSGENVHKTMKPQANGSPEKGIQHAELEYNIQGGTSSYTEAFSTTFNAQH